MVNYELKQKVTSGIFWQFSERVLAQGVSFLISIILARILMPEDYGIISMVLVFINISNVFVSNGLGESLIQKKDSNELDFSTIFHCSFTLSIILYCILFFAAPFIADFYHFDNIKLVFRVLSLKLIIASLSTVQHAYVAKHMIFKKFFFATFGGSVISGLLGIFMAHSGYGVWSLVVQYLGSSLMEVIVLFFIIPWRPKMIFSFCSAKTLVNYGYKLMLSSLINTVYGEMRSLFIGRIYTLSDLAFYKRGNTFPSLFITNIDTAISSVLFPAMSCCNSDIERVKQITKRAITITSYIIFPSMLLLFVISETLVRFLLTDKWLPCVPFLRIACVYYMFQPILTANWQAIKALGRSDLCLRYETIKKIIGVCVLIYVLDKGVYMIAFSAIIMAFCSCIINMYPNKKILNYGYLEQTKDLLPGLTMSITVALIISSLELNNFSLGARLFSEVSIFILLYILFSYFLKVESLFYLKNVIKLYMFRK